MGEISVNDKILFETRKRQKDEDEEIFHEVLSNRWSGSEFKIL